MRWRPATLSESSSSSAPASPPPAAACAPPTSAPSPSTTLDPGQRRARRHRRLEVERGLERLDVDDDLVDAVGRRGLGLGHHERHRLAGVDDLRARQRLPGATCGAVDERQVGRGEHRDHPRHVERRRAVDAGDPPVRLGGEDQPRVQQAVDGDVGRVARRAADLALAVAASPWNADRRARRRRHGHKVLSGPRPASVAGPAWPTGVDRAWTVPVRLPTMRHVVGDVPLGGSPFPPIADYAFLSDCEVCALVAPSGNVEWMCLPRFDGPSIFGAMLDRDAGSLPARARSTRRCPRASATCRARWSSRRRGARATGWVIVRDVLLIGPWHHDDERSHTHRRSPTDNDADHVLLRTMRCVNGRVEVHMECEPRVDYGRKGVAWEYAGAGYGKAVGTRRGRAICGCTLRTDLRIGFEGGARPRAHDPARRRHRVHRAVVERARRPRDLRRRLPPPRLHRRLLARVAQPRRVPRPPVAHLPAAQRAHAQGADLRADRRDDRGGDDVAARDARRRAQLGLPLRLDPRLDLHALGPLHAGLRRGGQRLLLLHPRRRLEERRRAADHVRHRRRGDADRGDAAAPRRLRARPAGARRQRRLRPAASTTCGARCSTRSTCTRKSRDGLAESTWEILRKQVDARHRRMARARPRDLGGARRADSTSPPRRSCAGSPATAARAWRACARTTSAASAGASRPTRSTRTSASTASTSAASSPSTTTRRRSTPRAC